MAIERSQRTPPPPPEEDAKLVQAAKILPFMSRTPPPSPEEDAELVQAAKILVSMSRSGSNLDMNAAAAATRIITKKRKEPCRRESYECHKCGVAFDTYQALGGHMTHHRVKRRVVALPKQVYVCYKCHMEFDKGTALGGHMRKHYKAPSPPNNGRRSSENHCGVDEDCSIAGSSAL